MKIKKWIELIICLCILVAVCICQADALLFYQRVNDLDDFRAFHVQPELLEKLDKEYDRGSNIYYQELARVMLMSKFYPDNEKSKPEGRFALQFGYGRPLLKKYTSLYEKIIKDVKYFPVGDDVEGGETTSFDDSWFGERTFGGNRKHEGCDIMTSNNQRGYFPVLSMTDGVVENMGWLKLGGYRIGIRSVSGTYFYYAHLYEYAKNLKEGDKVKAGQLIGFMGDSGYSDVEGTVGNFDVHLHLGIYIDYEGKETSVNPYYILKDCENKKRKYYNKN